MIFISHSPADTPVAKRLAKGLRARGVSVWIDAVDLRPGEDARTQVEQAMHDADAILILASPGPVPGSTRFEWSQALEAVWGDSEKRLIPVLLDGASAPPFVWQWQSIPLTREPHAIEQTISAIVETMRDAPSPLEQLPPDAVAALRQRLDEIGEAAKALASE